MGITTPDDDTADWKVKLPANIQRLLDSIEKGELSGLSVEQFTQVFNGLSSAAGAARLIIDSSDKAHTEAQESIRAAIAGDSEAVNHVAKNLKTDEARLEFMRICLERDKEKTKQAEAAAKVSQNHSGVMVAGLAFLGALAGYAVKLAINVKKIA